MTRALSHLAVACLLVWSSLTYAADPFIRGFDAVPNKATSSMNSGIVLEGADLWPTKSYRFALLFDLNVGVLSLQLGEKKVGELIPFRADAHLLFAYQLLERLELGIDLPVTFYQADNFQLLRAEGLGLPEGAGVHTVGLGDIRLVPRVSILTQKQFPVAVALVPELRLPTGDRMSFLGGLGVVFAPRLAVERAFGPVRVLGNIGYRLRTVPGQYLNLYVGNEFAMGGGVVVSLPDMWRFHDPKFVAEMHLATPVEAPFNFSQADSLKTPWEILVGARAKVHRRWGVELDVGRGLGLQTGYGRETLRILLALRYDNEMHDRDGDGIPDDVDMCPDEPEDFDGFEDSDGCPEPDNDKDGIPDLKDLCPNDPGPAEYEGCPDRDGDQIPDNVDKCPDEPGPAENAGCPSATPNVILESDRLRLNGNILFDTGEATIQKQSFKVLDEVYALLAEHPDVGPVLIEGHTDDRGSNAYNQDLSERRAKSVVDYLVHKGLSRKRLNSRGFGEEKPIADNGDALGRAKNRRTEFRLVKQPEDTTKEKKLPDTVIPNAVPAQPAPPAAPAEPHPSAPPVAPAPAPALLPAPVKAAKPSKAAAKAAAKKAHKAAGDAGTP